MKFNSYITQFINELKRHGLYTIPRTFNPITWGRVLFLQGRKIINKTLLPKQIGNKLNRRYRRDNVDAYLISFPKCGRTWLSLLIAKAIQELYPVIPERKLINLHDLHFYHKDIPYIYKTHDSAQNLVEFSIEDAIKKRLEKYRDYQIIYLIRNPLDVITSYYYQRINRAQNYQGTLEEFINEPEEGIDPIINFYNVWGKLAKELPEVKIVRYETLHDKPADELSEVLNFLGMSKFSDEVLNSAIEFASFENMKKMEKDNYFLTDTLKPNQKENKNTYKTRRGEVGGHKKDLTKEQKEKIESRIENKLNFFY